MEVALRDDELAVGSPAVGFSFGPHQVKEAEGFHEAFGLGLKLLQARQQELALQLGLDMLSRGGRSKRRGKRRGPRL